MIAASSTLANDVLLARPRREPSMSKLLGIVRGTHSPGAAMQIRDMTYLASIVSADARWS